jgi:hypothetical protein
MSDKDPISELLHTPVPQILWHYTSFDGFKGITESRKIFATDVGFLNDTQEFVHARSVAERIVQEAPEQGALLFPWRESLRKIVESSFGSALFSENTEVYVSSFSEHEDDLSQWRAYSHRGSGVSLGFDLSLLRPPDHINSLVCFAPCVYKPDKQMKLIRFALDLFVTGGQKYWTTVINELLKVDHKELLTMSVEEKVKLISIIEGHRKWGEQLDALAETTCVQVWKLASLLKNSTFEAEKEWRLVLPVGREKKKLKYSRKFRAVDNSLVPYIAFPLDEMPEGKLPLRKVVIGPGGHPKAESAISRWIDSLDLKVKVEVMRSKVPYRATT